jgi:Flp pilus assembly pilin Flp
MDHMNNETGQTSTEYAVVLAFVALVIVLSLGAVLGPFGDFVTKIVETITTALG